MFAGEAKSPQKKNDKKNYSPRDENIVEKENLHETILQCGKPFHLLHVKTPNVATTYIVILATSKVYLVV